MILNPGKNILRKFIALVVILCVTVCLSASAQWWKVSLKKHERFAALAPAKDHSIARLPVVKINIHNYKIGPANFAPGDYALELAEASVMKTAQHNMRFHVYDVASYNFSALAQLYMQQNRLSEAKWYLLQSNSISRQQNDDKHTITNLMSLAIVKAGMGEMPLAQQDLTEARQIAAARAWPADIAAIDKELKYIQLNGGSMSKTELRYADAIPLADKKTD
jgi:hypothetical protein